MRLQTILKTLCIQAENQSNIKCHFFCFISSSWPHHFLYRFMQPSQSFTGKPKQWLYMPRDLLFSIIFLSFPSPAPGRINYSQDWVDGRFYLINTMVSSLDNNHELLYRFSVHHCRIRDFNFPFRHVELCCYQSVCTTLKHLLCYCHRYIFSLPFCFPTQNVPCYIVDLWNVYTYSFFQQ